MSQINIGVRAHDYGQGSVKEIAERIGQYPVNCVQLALPKSFPFILEQPGQISPGFGNYVRDVFAEQDINIAVLGCYINPIHPDPVERELSLQRFEEHLQFARDFGCAIVGTETGSRHAPCTALPDHPPRAPSPHCRRAAGWLPADLLLSGHPHRLLWKMSMSTSRNVHPSLSLAILPTSIRSACTCSRLE